MLLRFGVSNHRSIRDYQELLLSASQRIKRRGMVIPAPTLKENAVPVVAIYGANAAGKSNLIDAIDDFRLAVIRSHKTFGASDRIRRRPFALDDTGRTRPTRFDCTFTVGQRRVDQQDPDSFENVYEYGFEFTDTEYEREWLLRVVRKERQSTHMLFERTTEDGQVQIRFGSQLRGENRTIKNLTRPNSLFLSAAAQNNHPQLTVLYRYFAENWAVVLDAEPMPDHAVAERLSGYKHMVRLLELVRQADVGISDITLEDTELEENRMEFMRDMAGVLVRHFGETDEEDATEQGDLFEQLEQLKQIRFMHAAPNGGKTSLPYQVESKGTRTLISILIPALDTLSRGGLLAIDELDTSLHSNLLRAFVSLFSKANSNPCGAQLVFTTHDVALLSSGIIHHDETWMTDKDHEGVTQFTPLTEFSLRSRDDIEKAYRYGRLGGVPDRDDFITIFEEQATKAEA